MKKLPDPKIYESEYRFMPWGKLLQEILRVIEINTPPQAEVLDLMCGPGHILERLHHRRKDLNLQGVDIDARYINYRKKKNQRLNLIRGDALKVKFKKKFDVIICTAGLHHLPYSKHSSFIGKINSLMKPGGYCILADPYIAPYRSESQRKLAAAELGIEYLRAVLKKNAPQEIITAAIDILSNDVLADGEYKTYTSRVHTIAKKYFSNIELRKTWPSKRSFYGDYYFILRRPK